MHLTLAGYTGRSPSPQCTGDCTEWTSCSEHGDGKQSNPCSMSLPSPLRSAVTFQRTFLPPPSPLPRPLFQMQSKPSIPSLGELVPDSVRSSPSNPKAAAAQSAQFIVQGDPFPPPAPDVCQAHPTSVFDSDPLPLALSISATAIPSDSHHQRPSHSLPQPVSPALLISTFMSVKLE